MRLPHLFHRWSLWVPYESTFLRRRFWATGEIASETQATEVRERRTCSICGKTQDRKIKDGPMWPQGAPKERAGA